MKNRRILSGVLAFGAALFLLSPSAAFAAGSLTDLEKEKAALESELESIEAKLDSLDGAAGKEEAYQESLSVQISLNLEKLEILEAENKALSAQIAQKEADIRALEEEIGGREALIARKAEEINETEEQYKYRMRAVYMAGGLSGLELLFAADSFSDFLTNIQMMKAVSAHDADLLSRLEREKEEEARYKAELEGEKASLEALKLETQERQQTVEENLAAAAATRQSLESDYAKSQQTVQNIELERQQFEADLSAKQAEAARVSAEIDAVYKSLQMSQAPSGGAGVGGVYLSWPLPGYSYISSPYGPRWGSFHTGMDISGGGVYGAPIAAAADGTVSLAGWHWSYGNYVIIDHGNGCSTLYAHCSALLVSSGQQVQRGQTIAQVGNTGNSYGAHLHFEVRINGAHQNPANYVSY